MFTPEMEEEQEQEQEAEQEHQQQERGVLGQAIPEVAKKRHKQVPLVEAFKIP